MIKFFKDLLFPKLCYVCQKEGSFLCVECLHKYIKVDPINRCHICNKESRIGFAHKDCLEYTNIDGVLNLTIYDGLIKKMIYDIKYNFYFEVAQTLSIIMADYLHFFNFDKDSTLLSFVPSAKSKIKARGFNQSEVLCRYLSISIGWKSLKILEKSKSTGAQAKLDKQGRAENLRGAFKLRIKKSTGDQTIIPESVENIIIVDDVFTTGATLNECARIIKSVYPRLKVYGFVIAKARN